MRKKDRLAIELLTLFALTSCGGGGTSQTSGRTTVTLWGWGDEAEIAVFSDLLKDYNNTNTDNVYVNFVKKPSGSYYSTLETALTGRQSPDLFYVGDSMVKRYANANYLQDLTSYIQKSKVIDQSDIWPTLMKRYQFNANTYQNSSDAPIWGLPKDIGPTVIFYNQDALEAQGIKIISAFDDDGDGTVSVDGQNYPARGYDPSAKVFNNKISMSFDELEELSKLTCHTSSIPSKHQTKWSFYSSWWFFAGWSVGGDCIQFKKTTDSAYDGGYWEFALNDKRPNYLVKKDTTLATHAYQAGSFVDYYDLDAVNSLSNLQSLLDDGTLVQEPSIDSMFEWWISLFHNGISPKPEDISTELALFTNQDVAMFVSGRYDVVQFRKSADFAWDCAPLPRYKDGVDAGHSGSMCLSMSTNCKNKDDAFKVIERLSGPEGQDALAEKGFNVPAQMSVAKDPSKKFLSSTLLPHNNEIFLNAASYQKGGDWTYLKDDAWINIWAPTLNGDVLNGVQTVDQLFNKYLSPVNVALKEYTKVN